MRNWLRKHFPLDRKVKLLQAFCYLGLITGMIVFWSWSWFLIGLCAGWFLWLSGTSSLHKWSAHRMFTPKNRLCKWILLFASTVTALGSNVSWAATHRKHHKYADHEGDPHSPNLDGATVWRSIRLWFYYFPTYNINPRTIKDLTVCKDHKWFHKNYFRINIIWMLALLVISPYALIYLYFLPVIYVFSGISYITVLAHNPWLHKKIKGYVNFETDDLTFNSKLMSVILPGEGNHNNHHANPATAKSAMKQPDWDLGFWWIRLMGKNINTTEYQQTYHA